MIRRAHAVQNVVCARHCVPASNTGTVMTERCLLQYTITGTALNSFHDVMPSIDICRL